MVSGAATTAKSTAAPRAPLLQGWSRTTWFVLINGLVVTAAAYWLLQYFVSQASMVNQKHQRAELVQTIRDDLQDIHSALAPAGYLIEKNADFAAAYAYLHYPKVKQTLPGLLYAFWLPRQHDIGFPGRVLFGDVSEGDALIPRIRALLERAPISANATEPTVIAIPELYPAETDTMIIGQNQWYRYKSEHLMIIKPTEAATPSTHHQAGYLIGLIPARHILELQALEQFPQLLRLTLSQYDGSALLDIYPVPLSTAPQKPPIDSADPRYFSRTLLSSIGQVELQIILEVDRQSQILAMIPMITGLIGFLLTILGTLYVRNNQRQSTMLTKVNRTLALKNMEMNAQVSERERLNQALRRTERESRAIMNAVSDIIFELDQHGKILFLSEAWARTLGYSIDQSLGRNLFEWMAPDRRERLAQELEQYLMGPAQKYHTNGSIETARGEWRAIELRYSMVRRDDQNNARIVGTLTDIQDQVKAEAALEETEQKFEQIWEHAVTGLYQVDLDGRLRSANPAMARIFGFESPSAMMATITDMQQELFPSARARQECLQTLKLEGHITNIESQARTRDGRLIWVLENARTVKNGLGKIVYYEGSLDDITERKNAEFALKDAMHESELANRSKTEFLANMSHELRTPLNSIIGFSEIIKDQVLGPVDQPQYLEYARDIHDSGTRLLSIISTILDVAKIEAGDRPLNETLFDVRGALEAVRDLVQSRVDQNAQELVIEIAPGLPRLLAEELAFKQMVLNLVTNAIKFTATGGRIHIQARREETGNFRLNVNDTGIGLDDEEIARLTAPFGQVSGNFARTSSGPGLGLTLVNSLVKLHGGHFEIVSRKGIGTTVSIILPASRLVYG